MTVEKPKPKQLLRPITTGAGMMNQSQFQAISCNSLEAREKSRVHGAIGFGFDSHWLKNWRESFEPITKRSNRNHVITFDSHLKTALTRLRLFRLVIGWKFSRQFFNQWEAKPIASCTRDFSRALSKLQVIDRSSDWFIATIACVVVDPSNSLWFWVFDSHLKTPPSYM